MPTHYEVLGIPQGASAEEVRHAYRRLAKEAHPDRAGDTARFRLVTAAYDVLSDPVRRAAYDRSLRPTPVVAPILPPASGRGPAPPPAASRPPRYGRYVALLAVSALAGVVTWLVVATASQSVGDDCLVGTWRGENFDVPFRGVLDGREIDAPIRGGGGVTVAVAEDGTVRTDYAGSAPLVGNEGLFRIEGVYAGSTRERWRADAGRVTSTVTDASDLVFRATISGRPPDQPLQPSVLDGEYPYACTDTILELGPYRYTRTN